MKITTNAKDIAERTQDAYSADRFASWSAVAQVLLDRGYNEAETIEIMRSKWTRWAADRSNASYGKATSTHMIAWLDASHTTRAEERAAVQKELMAGR